MASETPIVTRSNKWATIKDLVNYKKGIVNEKIEDSPAIQHGVKFEDEARDWANAELGLMFEPDCYEYGKYAASLDGIDTNCIAEIKCPWSNNSSAYSKEVRLDHYEQVQHQLYVAQELKIDTCFYIVYNAYEKRGYVKEIRFNKERFMKIMDLWDRFVIKYGINV